MVKEQKKNKEKLKGLLACIFVALREAPYVSGGPHMFEKSPICLKKWPIGSPYVGLPEAFLPHMLKKAPYVANRVPICGPYVPHMWPIGFDCSSEKKSWRVGGSQPGKDRSHSCSRLFSFIFPLLQFVLRRSKYSEWLLLGVATTNHNVVMSSRYSMILVLRVRESPKKISGRSWTPGLSDVRHKIWFTTNNVYMRCGQS